MFKTLGRLFLAWIFISGGASVFANPDGRASKVAAAGIPKARQSTILNSFVMIVAGSLLGLDIAPKLSALALVGSLIPTTLVGHPFWNEENPANRAGQHAHFLKNLGLIGGLLTVLTEKNND
jgi:putative oxidoreductase